MKISDITVAAMLALCTSTAFAQTYTKAQQQAWMEKAGLCKPVLDTTVCHPVAVVDIVKDDKAFQGYKAVPRPGIDDLYTKSFKQMKSVTLDFGRHMVRLGADTFWEYYVPEDHMFSSYNGYTLLNSYCHAWSCTPVYFIVNYPDVFQR